MTALGWTHTLMAVVTLTSGAAALLNTKGTTRHRQLGWIYVVGMVGLNGTALCIYRLFGGFGPFHAFAIFSLLTVLLGVRAALGARRHRRANRLPQRGRALEQHYAWMTWSYVGLCAAAVSEVATRIPALHPTPDQRMAFGLTVAAASLCVVAIGGRLVRRRKASLLAPFIQSAG